ncbi:MAG: hypothetical protein H7Z10_07490 [Gemmatimonadaceae bacterium]|nr:hypothetical protein [Acetobacteraceae bacterium]
MIAPVGVYKCRLCVDIGRAGVVAKVLVAFQTHVFDWQMQRVFGALTRSLPPGFEAVVLVHLAPGAPVPTRLAGVPHLVARTPDIRVAAYGDKSGLGRPDWSFYEGQTDLLLLHLTRAWPGYAHYWTVEYDVRFTGRWRDFFCRFSDSDADLLAANIWSAADHPAHHYLNTLRVPEGIAAPRPDDLMSCFLPVFRASARLVDAVDRAYRSGWSGHSEVTWPTIARHENLSIEDLGGTGPYVRAPNRGQVYSSNIGSWELSPGTFAFKPIKHVLLQRNMLWHPVKPIVPTLREDWGRVRKRARRLSRQWWATLSGTGPGRA